VPRAKRSPRASGPATRRVGRVAEVPVSPYAARRLLLDTNAWLWWQANDRRLGRQARAGIASASEVYLSAASALEIAIKASIGKLRVSHDPTLGAQLESNGFRELPVSIVHAEAVRGLPMRHADPFDRLLIAQARVEGLVLVTADALFEHYDVAVLDASN